MFGPTWIDAVKVSDRTRYQAGFVLVDDLSFVARTIVRHYHTIMAYTYLIGWKAHDKYYYGMRYANDLAPNDDLWSVYKPSSVYVHKFVEEFGEPDVIRVHKEFEDKDEAYLFETRFLRRVDAVNNERWLNQNIAGRPQGGTPAQLAAVKGKKQSEETKIKRGIYKKQSPEHVAKKVAKLGNNPVIGKRLYGKDNPQFGRKRTPEQIENIRQGQLRLAERRRQAKAASVNDLTSL